MTVQPITQTSLLPSTVASAVLRHLDVEMARPDLDGLDRLVDAYIRTVPWESAFRIAKRAATRHRQDCPRWPLEFWRDALDRGGGGTCFESNYAFFSLLRALGYEGYLTINDMGESVGCHTACVIHLEAKRWLVDVGIPLHVPIPLDTTAPTRRVGPFHTYTISPHGDGTFEVSRDRHPNPYVFTLVDQPRTDGDYRAATTADYGPDGHFLDRVIVTKVIGGRMWRFNSGGTPYRLESFGPQKSQQSLPADPALALAHHFEMDAAILEAALAAVSPL